MVARTLKMTVTPTAAPIDGLQANIADYLVTLPANYLERFRFSTTDLRFFCEFEEQLGRGGGRL